MESTWAAKKSGLGLTLCLAFMGILFFYSGCLAQSAQAKDETITYFGNGKVKVRLYTDYFCVPCRAVEPRIEGLLKSLVKKNLINITFIDAPFHKFSSMYARYFLFILNENRNFEYALSAREILFEAAKENVTEAEKLEEYLKKKGIKFSAFDVRPVFVALERSLRDDNINATPTCVIERDGKKEMFKGGDDIAKALEGLNGGRLPGDKKPATPEEKKK
jgi:thiol-disulfide isomerase/thioredoxin